MHTITVGVDIAKAIFDAARRDAEGRYKHKKFGNDAEGFVAFVAWLADFGDERPLIRMEATGAYSHPLAEFLFAQGWPVGVVNPACIAAFAKAELSRAKTDKNDAKSIARFAREKQPALWKPSPANLHALQTLLRRIGDLQAMRQMEKNRLDTAGRDIAPSIETIVAALDTELQAIQQRLQQHIDDDPDYRKRRDLLVSIPGIADTTAIHLLAVLDPHYGFTSAKQVTAYAGLDVRIRDSGKKQGFRLSPSAR